MVPVMSDPPSPMSSALSSLPSSPSGNIHDADEQDDIPNAGSDHDPQSDSGEDSDGADSVTHRIREFNRAAAKEEARSKVPQQKQQKETVRRKAKEESEAESTDYEDGPKKKTKAKKTKKKGKAEGQEPKKKALRAKAAFWDDLPDWGDRTDSPLLELPGEVLDRCFGIHQDLELRDWVALAGLNQFFRHSLDDSFFHELWFEKGKESIHGQYGYHLKSKQTSTMIDGVSTTILTDNRPKGHPGQNPFTRDVKPWWIDPTIPILPAQPPADAAAPIPGEPIFKHYTPRGRRSKWTKSQFTVYKEEKSRFVDRQHEERRLRAVEAAEKALAASKRRTIKAGRLNRTVLGVVMGRQDGEEVAENEKKESPVAEAEQAPAKRSKRRKSGKGEVSAEAMALWEFAKTPKWLRDAEEKWEVPETDGEDELGPEVQVAYDLDGAVMPDDYWPSKWRKIVAEGVNTEWLNQTETLKKYKVSKAELATLRHLQISNPLNPKQYQKMYIKTAVQALAYRSHGGEAGHIQYLTNAASRARSAIEAKQGKRDEARAAGQIVPARKHVKNPMEAMMVRVWGGDEWYIDCSRSCWCKTGGWK